MSNWLKIGITCTAIFSWAVWDGRRQSERKRNSRLARGKRFVIVGGGFGGTAAAQELSRLLPDTAGDPEIVLIDQRDYLLFTPMLTEAVGARIEPHHIIVPLNTFSKRIRTIRGTVKSIDLKTRTIAFTSSKLRPISADYLVLALGASSNFHGIEGVEDTAYTLKSLDDAYGIRQNATEMVKIAAEEKDPETQQANLTFVVAGGGYTGVEGIAALNELVKENVADAPDLRHVPVRMILAEPMKRLMSEVTPDLASYSQAQLEKDGIRVMLDAGIKGVKGDEIEFSNGEHVRASTFIWTAGIRANPLMSKLGVSLGKSKGVKVDGTLAMSEAQGVWAVGDCAEIPKSDGSGNYGPTAQNALREGILAARNIVRTLRGEAQKPFTYIPIGELALVGKRKGVARVYGFNFSGFTAYVLWRGAYIMKMPSLTQRIRVLSDWCLDALLGPAAEYHISAAPGKQKAAAAQR